MCTIDIIDSILKKKKLTQAELCAYIGKKKQTYTNWKNGDNTSYMKYLPQIAEFLDVSIDYLLGSTETKKNTAEDDSQLRQLNDIFIRLNDDGRAKLLEQAIMMEASGLYSDNKVIKIAARTGHTTSTVPGNLDDFPDAPDTI